MRAAGAKVIAEFVAKNPLLEELEIVGNMIGDDGITDIAKALPLAAKLRVLNIGK